MHAPCCNITETFTTPKSQMSLTLTFLWLFWTFKLAQGQTVLWITITPQECHALCYNLTGMFSTSKSLTSSMLTFLRTFWTYELAHGQMGDRQQHFVNTIYHINILEEFNIYLCVTFLNFQTKSRWSCLWTW